MFCYPLMFSWIDITIPAIEPINMRIDIIATYISNGSMAATHVIGTPNILIIAKNMLKLNAAPNIYLSSSLISSIIPPPQTILRFHHRIIQ